MGKTPPSFLATLTTATIAGRQIEPVAARFSSATS